ncbi:hypothetical protein BS17DRAFT_521334 [Gyrodon lividus]|nr:hypothetical protein BS17DRAFT_521334 [Gyrodon lividus]
MVQPGSASSDNAVHFWDIDSGEPIGANQHDSAPLQGVSRCYDDNPRCHINAGSNFCGTHASALRLPLPSSKRDGVFSLVYVHTIDHRKICDVWQTASIVDLQRYVRDSLTQSRQCMTEFWSARLSYQRSRKTDRVSPEQTSSGTAKALASSMPTSANGSRVTPSRVTQPNKPLSVWRL